MKRFGPFLLISYLVAISGVANLFAAGAIGLPWFLGFLGVAGICITAEDGRFQLSNRNGTVLALLAIPIFLGAWRLSLITPDNAIGGFGGMLGILIQLVILIKLGQRKSSRDWVFIYLVSFFAFLLSSAIAVSISFGFLLTIHMGLTIAGILLMELKRGEARIKQSKQIGSVPSRKILNLSFTITLAIIILTIPLFFLLPRLGAAGFGETLTGLSSQTGFTDSVRLGSIGRIQMNEATVMRIKVDDTGVRNSLRWNGVALDYFDNENWRSSQFRYSRGVDRDGSLFLLKKPIGEGRMITQNIFLEPIDTPVIFGLSELIAVQGSFSGIEANAEDSYRILRGGFERRNYLATSLLRDVNPNKLREDSKNYRYEESRYLQMPPTLDSRIGQLAEEVVSALTDRNIYDSAKSIENHLQTSYGYTLEQKASGEQPLADFLFNVREGHCEYFATAMAVMLRTQGIATRVVNGFQTGEFNPTTGYFTVRQRDAHSWVEVYFPDSDQWVAFDPTPPAGLGRADEVGAFASLRRLTDTIETLWIQYFISYDSVGQRGVLVSLWGQFAGVQKNLTLLMDATVSGIEGMFFASSEGDSKEGDLSNGISIVVFILVLFGSILLLTKVIAHQRSRRTENKGKGPPGFYRELVAILAKSGSTRRASQTPMEFAEETGLREAVELTAIYHRIRFGERTLDRSTHERIKALLRDLRKALNAS